MPTRWHAARRGPSPALLVAALGAASCEAVLMILVAYDGSDEAKRAVAVAGSLFSGPAVVLHVVVPQTVVTPHSAPGALGPDAGQLIETDDEALERGRDVAEAGAEMARREGLAAEPALAHAPEAQGVAETIVRIGDERGAAVLVLGRRGLGRVASAIMGSVSDGVLRQASRPVLVVPSPD
jgi:nucleotide-binding universal stress UspA family protein